MLTYEKMTLRNIGIFTEEQQARLRNATVALAGVGGVGGVAAERLARMGIGRLRIADPDIYEPSNFNRQFASAASTLGQNKALAVAAALRDMNPLMDIDLVPGGIYAENADAFVAGSDVVVEEIEYCYLDCAVALHQAARRHGLYSLTTLAVGFGTSMLVYDPHGMTCEEYLGLPIDITPDAMRDIKVPLAKFVPRVPSYITPEVLEAVLNGTHGYLPTVSVGCAIAGALAAAEAAAILTGIRPPRVVPEIVTMDLLESAS